MHKLMHEELRLILSQLHQAGRIMGDKPRGEEIQADIDDAERRLLVLFHTLIGANEVSYSVPLAMPENIYNALRARDGLRVELRRKLEGIDD